MNRLKVLLMAFLFIFGLGTLALAGGPKSTCPDADNDGICNGQDPDYVPGGNCSADCPDADNDGICNCQDPDYVPGGRGNPDCPDADGDGICNGQDPDYTAPGGGGARTRLRDHIHDAFRIHLHWM